MNTKFALPLALMIGSAACSEQEDTSVLDTGDTGDFIEDFTCLDEEYRETVSSELIKNILLAVHIDVHSNVDISGIERDVAVLNREFAPIVGEFIIDSIDYYGVEEQPLPSNFEGVIDLIYSTREIDEFPGYAARDIEMEIDGEDIWFEGHVVMNTEISGRVISDYVLAHEMGHVFSLDHPFEFNGDGIEDTVDYEVVCGDGDETLVYEADGVCMKSCSDGSYAEPANIMNIDYCLDPVDGTQWEERFTGTQLDVMRCDLHSRLSHYIGW